VDTEVLPPQEPHDYGPRAIVSDADRLNAAHIPASKSATITGRRIPPPYL